MLTSAFLLLLAIFGAAVPSAAAKDDAGGPACCAHCGRHEACVTKTCQVVCGVKKETKISWEVECEEFCPLLPGHRQCGECAPPPRCGNSKCVKKLVKKQYQVEVPVYQCVVRHLCADCASGQSPPSTAPSPIAPVRPEAAPLPPPPPKTPPRPPAPETK
jgi:hypothetical protein